MRQRQRLQRAEADIATAMQTYEHAGLIIAEVAAFILWLIPWALNLFFTALFVQGIASRLVVALSSVITSVSPEIPRFGLSPVSAWCIGILAHLMISSVEIHLWRSGRWGDYPVIIGISVLDVMTTVLGVIAFALSLGLAVDSFLARLLSTVISMTVALVPEKRLIQHAVGVYVLLRRRSA
ncbi:MAG TPA: hypothetical protein VFS21_07255 [Roseiflexaceae bacterium]|nr:hypothetical protein [Roseiflexaceae bacterium]